MAFEYTVPCIECSVLSQFCDFHKLFVEVNIPKIAKDRAKTPIFPCMSELNDSVKNVRFLCFYHLILCLSKKRCHGEFQSSKVNLSEIFSNTVQKQVFFNVPLRFVSSPLIGWKGIKKICGNVFCRQYSRFY